MKFKMNGTTIGEIFAPLKTMETKEQAEEFMRDYKLFSAKNKTLMPQTEGMDEDELHRFLLFTIQTYIHLMPEIEERKQILEPLFNFDEGSEDAAIEAAVSFRIKTSIKTDF